MSPYYVKYVEERKSFVHFLTSCCAIIGGVIAVTGIISSSGNNHTSMNVDSFFSVEFRKAFEISFQALR